MSTLVEDLLPPLLVTIPLKVTVELRYLRIYYPDDRYIELHLLQQIHKMI